MRAHVRCTDPNIAGEPPLMPPRIYQARARRSLAVIGLAVGGYFVWRGAPARRRRRRAAAGADARRRRPATFARWLRFEPDAVRGQRSGRRPATSTRCSAIRCSACRRAACTRRSRASCCSTTTSCCCRRAPPVDARAAHQPGLAGKFCYVHSTYCLRRLFDVSFFVDGKPVVIYDNQYWIERYPSHTVVHYELADVTIDERKFITYDDRAVATYAARARRQEAAHRRPSRRWSPYPAVPGSGDAAPAYPLLGSGDLPGHAAASSTSTRPASRALDAPTIHLRRDLAVPADGAADEAPIAVRFDNQRARRRRPRRSPDADRRAGARRTIAGSPTTCRTSTPPTRRFKKMWYYRWWVVRFNMRRADTPDLKGYRFYEGKLGFDNAIVFAVPVQLKELTYLRDPRLRALRRRENSYRNLAANGARRRPARQPVLGRDLLALDRARRWPSSTACIRSRADTLRALLPAMAADVRAWLSAYDPDGDGLPERDRPRVTGYDLDILSYWYFNGTTLDLQRRAADSRARRLRQLRLRQRRGVAELATRRRRHRPGRRSSTAHRRSASAPPPSPTCGTTRRSSSTRSAPATTRARRSASCTASSRSPRCWRPTSRATPRRSAKFVDPKEFWARFPPVITSLHHYRDWTWEMDGLTPQHRAASDQHGRAHAAAGAQALPPEHHHARRTSWS